jgi:hypothetical protein
MSAVQIPQDKLNQLASTGVSKLANKIGLKDTDTLALAQNLGQKGAGMLGKFANKKLGKFRKLVGFKAGGVIVMKDVGAGSAPKSKAKGKRGRPKGSKNKK